MQTAAYLKKLLTGYVTIYQTLFVKTFKAALLLTILSFLIAGIIGHFFDYDSQLKSKPISILSYFFSRFSYKEIYAFGDTVKTIFLFLVSVFSVNLIRNENKETGDKINVKDILSLLATMVTCILLDCALFRLEGQLRHGIDNKHLSIWIGNVIFFLRIFLPLIFFALVIHIRTSNAVFTLKKVFLLFISVWFFNELAYELTIIIRGDIFELILSAVDQVTYYWLESILGVGLISTYFLGYYFAMVAPLNLSVADSTN